MSRNTVPEYEAEPGELLKRTGAEGASIADMEARMATPDNQMTDAVEAETTDQLSSMIASKEQLQHDLSHAQEELQALRKELEWVKIESRHDSLTQLPNRRAFEERLCELLARCERHGERYVLVLFDIDRFKSFNDTFGHATGDAILAAIGKVLIARRRATDHVSRIGGEEFAILLTQTSLPLCQGAVERYRKAIAATKLKVDGRQHQVTASFGAAEMAESESLDSLRRRADEALYAAKNKGRNRTYLHDGVGAVPALHDD